MTGGMPGARTGRRVVTEWALVLLLVLAHYVARPFLPARPAPDFLLVAVLFVAVRVRPGVAAVMGLLCGLAVDAAGPAPLGSAALLWLLVAYGAASMRAVLFSDQAVLPGGLALVGHWGSAVLLAFTRPEGTADRSVAALLGWAPLSALASAAVAVVAHLMARDPGRARPR